MEAVVDCRKGVGRGWDCNLAADTVAGEEAPSSQQAEAQGVTCHHGCLKS